MAVTEINFDKSYSKNLGILMWSMRVSLEKYKNKQWKRKVNEFLKDLNKKKVKRYQDLPDPKLNSLLKMIQKRKIFYLQASGNNIIYLFRDFEKIMNVEKSVLIEDTIITTQKVYDGVEPVLYMVVNSAK